MIHNSIQNFEIACLLKKCCSMFVRRISLEIDFCGHISPLHSELDGLVVFMFSYFLSMENSKSNSKQVVIGFGEFSYFKLFGNRKYFQDTNFD